MKYFLRDPKNLRFIGIIAFAIALLIVLSVYLVTRLGDANTNNRLQQNALSAESVIFQKLLLIQSKVLSNTDLFIKGSESFSALASGLVKLNPSIVGLELRTSNGSLLSQYQSPYFALSEASPRKSLPPWLLHQFSEAVIQDNSTYSPPYSANLLQLDRTLINPDFLIEEYIPLTSKDKVLVVIMRLDEWLSPNFLASLDSDSSLHGFEILTESGVVIARTDSSKQANTVSTSIQIPFNLPGLKLFLRAEYYEGADHPVDGLLPLVVGSTSLIVILFILFIRSLFLQIQVEKRLRIQEEVILDQARLASLGEMTSTLSHELNQPIAAIETYATSAKCLIESGEPIDHQLLLKALTSVTEQAHRAGETIKGIRKLFYSKSSDEDAISISGVLNNLLPMIELQAIRYNGKFKVTYAAEAIILVNRLLCEQVILNLSLNAFQAMKENVPSRRNLEIVVKVEGKEFCTISFVDQGHGVSESISQNLFKPFFSTKNNGMGLGLSLSRTLMERFRGELLWRNLPSGGAEFTIRLPIVK
jgi:signal transduction histidine kinase